MPVFDLVYKDSAGFLYTAESGAPSKSTCVYLQAYSAESIIAASRYPDLQSLLLDVANAERSGVGLISLVLLDAQPTEEELFSAVSALFRSLQELSVSQNADQSLPSFTIAWIRFALLTKGLPGRLAGPAGVDGALSVALDFGASISFQLGTNVIFSVVNGQNLAIQPTATGAVDLSTEGELHFLAPDNPFLFASELNADGHYFSSSLLKIGYGAGTANAGAGQIALEDPTINDLDLFDIGFPISISPRVAEPAPPQGLLLPFLTENAREGLLGTAITSESFRISPSFPEDWQLGIAVAASWSGDSCYSTRGGAPVKLAYAPGPTASELQLSATESDRFVLSPAGQFAIAPMNGATLEIVGGLSATEYFALETAGMTIDFGTPNTALKLTARPTGDSGSPSGWAFQIAPDCDLKSCFGNAQFSPPKTVTYYYQPTRNTFYDWDTANPIFLKNDPQLFGLDYSSQPRSIPLLPYAGVVADPNGLIGKYLGDFADLEATSIAPARQAALAGLPDTAPDRQHTYLVTPTGFIGTVADSGARLNQFIFSQMQADAGLQLALQTNNSSQLPASLFADHQFCVITRPPTGFTIQANGCFSGWSFTGNSTFTGGPGPAALPDADDTVMILKGARGSLAQLVAHPEAWSGYSDFNNTSLQASDLAQWLSQYFDTARSLYNSGVDCLASLVAILDDPDWNGVILLQVPVTIDQCSDAVQTFIAGSVDSLVAHHIVHRITPLQAGDTKPTPLDGSAFGAVLYSQPGSVPGVLPATPPVIELNSEFDWRLVNLAAGFQNSRLDSFFAVDLLTMKTIFGDPVTDSASPAALLFEVTATGNAGNDPQYRVALAPGFAGAFPVNSPMLTAGAITNAVGSYDINAKKLSLLLDGYLTLNPGQVDLLSYAAVNYTGLEIDIQPGPPPTVAISLTNLVIQPGAEQAIPNNETPAADLARNAHLYRTGSMVAQLPLTVNSFFTGDANTNLPFSGWFPVQIGAKGEAANQINAANWYALVLDLHLGDGESSDLLSAQLLIRWASLDQVQAEAHPNDDDRTPQLFFRLLGPGGIATGTTINNVLKLGFGGARILPTTDAHNVTNYTIALQDFGLSVLSHSFPPAGTTDVVLGGFTGQDGTRRIAWFGGYAAKT